MSVSTTCAPSNKGRLPVVVVAAIMLAAFGPYTPIPGVRTEQLAVYGAAVAATCLWPRHGTRPTGGATLIGLLLATQIAVAAMGGILPPVNTTEYQTGSFLSGLDQQTLPLAVLTIVVARGARGANPRRLLQVACTVLVAAMCLNAALALTSMTHDLTGVLAHWWTNRGAGEVLGGQHAINAGRYTGLVNAPAEAGELYAAALLAAIYLYQRRAAVLLASATLITIGGVVAVSKTFLFVGLPIAGWQLLRWLAQRPSRTVAAILTAAAAVPLLLDGRAWRGAAVLGTFFAPGGSTGLYTAGRFGATSTLAPVVHAVMSTSPWFGFGAGGLVVALDNGWVEAMAVSGLCGVLLYTGVLLVMAAVWWRRRRGWDRATSQFAGGLVLLAVGASLGLPALTGNRVATVMWLLLALLLFARSEQGEEQSLVGDVEEPAAVSGDVRRVQPRVPARATSGLAVLEGQVVARHDAGRLGQGGLGAGRR